VVRVYAGVDPVTKKRHDRVEFIPPGPKAEAQAEAARVRLVNQVNERRHPRTAATVDQLLDRYGTSASSESPARPCTPTADMSLATGGSVPLDLEVWRLGSVVNRLRCIAHPNDSAVLHRLLVDAIRRGEYDIAGVGDYELVVQHADQLGGRDDLRGCGALTSRTSTDNDMTG
jgi:hypothetical protein